MAAILRELTKLRNGLVFSVRYPDYSKKNLGRVDCVAVFPRLGIVYNRIKKSANTSIVAWLADLEGVTYDSLSSVKREVPNPRTLSLAEVLHFGSYYSFTFVRNPYARVLSAYLDKVATGNPHYAATPGSGQAASPEGFEVFLDFLEAGGLHANRHWWPQTDLLYKPADQFSFIGKVERMEQDMEEVLRNIRVAHDSKADFQKPHSVKTRATSASNRLETFYSAKARDIVGRLYRDDFHTFGYPDAQ